MQIKPFFDVIIIYNNYIFSKFFKKFLKNYVTFSFC